MAEVSASGLSVDTLEEVQTALAAAWRGAFGADADLDTPESPDAQIVGILAEREASLQEALEALYSATRVASAIGTQLDGLARLAGVTRLPARATTAAVRLVGTSGTVLAAGRVIELQPSGARFVLPAATIGVGGTVDVTATAEATGPTVVLAGAVWTIATPVSGWTGVTSLVDGETGRDLELDDAFRARLLESVGSVGTMAGAVRAAIARLGVDEVIVRENVLYAVDAEGRPPKSFEVIVRGGADDEIATTIWSLKPDGIEAYGSTGVVVTDALGQLVTVYFTRPTEVPVYVEVELAVDDQYPVDGNAQVSAAALSLEAALRIGTAVSPFAIIQRIETPGIQAATVRVGRTSPPVQTIPLAMGSREIAALDTSRITVTTRAA